MELVIFARSTPARAVSMKSPPPCATSSARRVRSRVAFLSKAYRAVRESHPSSTCTHAGKDEAAFDIHAGLRTRNDSCSRSSR